jgi:hypothetical protein
MKKSTWFFILGRYARDLQAVLKYPVWCMQGRHAPDNHVYKKRRIKRLARAHGCDTFIETGTFYGQMVNFARGIFRKVISVEIYPPFHRENTAQFARDPDVRILLGDSGKNLPEAISLASGRILFWLDGHYSGSGTGIGDKVSPIIEELRLIARAGRRGDCIVIDDKRLFTGVDGYPTLEAAMAELKEINPEYVISIDRDSIVAESPESISASSSVTG